MRPEIRRIIAVEAHRRRTGQCPVRVHSLGTGETFEIRPTADGFVDETSNLAVRISDERILIPDADAAIDLRLTGDVTFEGVDNGSRETFTGRAGGGASVTIYDAATIDFFQYAVATPTMQV
jgi:hypothetical protein